MAHTKNTKNVKVRALIIIEKGLKRAALQQSFKNGCESRCDQGSFSEFGRQAVIEKLQRLGINTNNLIANG